MIKKQAIKRLPNNVFKDLGWDYFVSEEAADYLTKELLIISEAEGEAFYQAANECYDMLFKAVDKVIIENRLSELGIPKNLHEIIRLTWEDERQLHLFARFDFAGGLNGLPIKLLEINANTPTMMPETALIQWAQLKANGIDETAQYNSFYESWVAQFEELLDAANDRDATLLISTLRDAPEDESNMSLMARAAEEAGFTVAFQYIDEVIFSPTEGIFIQPQNEEAQQFEFWLQLVPWEFIAEDEPELLDILTQIVKNDLALIFNPAWTMVMQSKGLLKILWDMFPNSPYLLKTTYEQPIRAGGEKFVKKTMLGREGANVAIFNGWGELEEERGGDYEHYPYIYQSFAQLAHDAEDYYYQAGVFYIGEACGIGFRRAKGRIMDNGSQFLGHTVI